MRWNRSARYRRRLLSQASRCAAGTNSTRIRSSLALAFGVPFAVDLKARYNVAPSQELPVVRIDREGTRELAAMRRGLIPHWAKDKSIDEAPNAGELLKPYPTRCGRTRCRRGSTSQPTMTPGCSRKSSRQRRQW